MIHAQTNLKLLLVEIYYYIVVFTTNCRNTLLVGASPAAVVVDPCSAEKDPVGLDAAVAGPRVDALQNRPRTDLSARCVGDGRPGDVEDTGRVVVVAVVVVHYGGGDSAGDGVVEVPWQQ